MSKKKDDFFELYRRPEWQEKRLRVMEAARFECEECGDKDETLNVHHRFYTKGAKPWEYDNEDLQCLCERCHESRHQVQNALKVAAGFLDKDHLEVLDGYCAGLLMAYRANPDTENDFYSVWSYEFASGIADAYRIAGGAETVLANLIEHANARGITHAILNAIYCDQKKQKKSVRSSASSSIADCRA